MKHTHTWIDARRPNSFGVDTDLDHFADRLWERVGLAATPDVVGIIKGYIRSTPRALLGTRKGREIYRVPYGGHLFYVWTTLRPDRRLITCTDTCPRL
jgi:hypothetical protein